jgi:hypothetical protein
MIALTSIGSSPPGDFERLLTSPHAFHHKRVSLTGVAHIYGDEFFLYQNAYTAKKSDPSQAVLIVPNRNKSLYEKLNNHWVKVTGIVDATAHGLLGSVPCEITPTNVTVVSGPSLEDQDVYAVFRNETDKIVNLRAPAPGGYADVDLKPGQVSTFVIAKGTAVVHVESGKAQSKTELMSSRIPKPYLISGKQTYYYKITKDKIEIVSAKDAQAWNR